MVYGRVAADAVRADPVGLAGNVVGSAGRGARDGGMGKEGEGAPTDVGGYGRVAADV